MSILLYQDDLITCLLADQTATLTFQSRQAAGAIGKAQGESWRQALTCLQHTDFQQLNLSLNSAGAHFGEPLEGLLHLNLIAEGLWQLRLRGTLIHVECPGWLYGGMAIVLASVAHRITLHPGAHMGLFGTQLLPPLAGKTSAEPIPPASFRPEHLELKRLLHPQSPLA